jgi:hypothetical protein
VVCWCAFALKRNEHHWHDVGDNAMRGKWSKTISVRVTLLGKRNSGPGRDAASIDEIRFGRIMVTARMDRTSCDFRRVRPWPGCELAAVESSEDSKWLCVKEKWVIAALARLADPARFPTAEPR